jgi:uncharacterized membrane protein YraQ (UPF0718 family)
MSDGFAVSRSPLPSRRALVVALLAFVVVFAAGLAWAKWVPYWHKGFAVSGSHSLGDSVITGGAATAPDPSWSASLDYATSYLKSIWPALVAALLISAGVQTLVPRAWPARILDDRRGGWRGPLSGAGLAVPSLMCTCCTAPVAVGLRKRGAGVASALAYWVGNPALNPAVLVFIAFVLPWQWVALRGVFGIVMVAAVAGVGRWLARSAADPPEPVQTGPATLDAPAGELPLRYLKALARLAITLIPEYVVIVFLLGALRGPLFPLADAALVSGAVGIVLLAIAGTLFVIPTAAEIPIVQGLLLLGIGAGPAGALLVTLPAMSVPSLVMVGRSFPKRVLLGVAVACAAVGMVCGAVAAALV